MTIRQFLLPGIDQPVDSFRDWLRASVDGFPGYVNDPAVGFLSVTQRAASANMSVDVAPGACYIPSNSPIHGFNFLASDAVTNVPITAAHATNGRRDLIVARWRDAAEFGDSETSLKIEAVTGVAAPSPLIPAVPARCLHLATIVINPAAPSIVNANINPAAKPSGLIQTAAKVRSGGYSFTPTSAFAKINYGTADYDYGGDNFAAMGAAHSYVCKAPGLYRVKARQSWTYSNSPQYAALAPFVSGVEADRVDDTRWTSGTPVVGLHGSWDLKIALPTQTIDMRFFKDGGNALPMVSGTFSVERVA